MREIIATSKAPSAIGPYSQAIKTESLVFVSGQIALNPQGQLVGETVVAQTRQVFQNLQAILESAGSGLDQVVKASVFLANLQDFQAMNEVYGEFLGQVLPARETIQAAALPRSALVEISVIAQIP
jgi:2-iminobutanoate/2-iminopropanoate deaminase